MPSGALVLGLPCAFCPPPLQRDVAVVGARHPSKAACLPARAIRPSGSRQDGAIHVDTCNMCMCM